MAIWKVEYDDTASLSTGFFQFADSRQADSIQHLVYAQAAAYLAGFDGTQSSGDATLFRATSHPEGLYQDLVGPGTSASTPASPAIVPEPASIAMLVDRAWPVGLLVARRRMTRALRPGDRQD